MKILMTLFIVFAFLVGCADGTNNSSTDNAGVAVTDKLNGESIPHTETNKISLQRKAAEQLVHSMLDQGELFRRASDGTEVIVDFVQVESIDKGRERQKICYKGSGSVALGQNEVGAGVSFCEDLSEEVYRLKFLFEDTFTGTELKFEFEENLTYHKAVHEIGGEFSVSAVFQVPGLSQMLLMTSLLTGGSSGLDVDINASSDKLTSSTFSPIQLENQTKNGDTGTLEILKYSKLQTVFINKFLPGMCERIKIDRAKQRENDNLNDYSSVVAQRRLEAYEAADKLNCEEIRCDDSYRCDYFKDWKETQRYKDLKFEVENQLDDLEKNISPSNQAIEHLSFLKIDSCVDTGEKGGALGTLKIFNLGIESQHLSGEMESYEEGNKQVYVYQKQKIGQKSCYKKLDWATIEKRRDKSTVARFGYPANKNALFGLCTAKSTLALSDIDIKSWRSKNDDRLQKIKNDLEMCFY